MERKAKVWQQNSALVARASSRDGQIRELTILYTLGKLFFWIRVTFLEVVIHRTSVWDLGACSNLVRTYLVCLAYPYQEEASSVTLSVW